MRKIRILLVIIFVLGFGLVFYNPLWAQEKSWDFEKWEVDIEIFKDGTFVVLERMNGKIWFESQEGKGSTFSFSLPLAR